jgi:hypothetical protein
VPHEQSVELVELRGAVHEHPVTRLTTARVVPAALLDRFFHLIDDRRIGYRDSVAGEGTLA